MTSLDIVFENLMKEVGENKKGARERKYPIPLMKIDRSGMIKLLTLENLIFEWKSAKELLNDSIFETYIYLSDWRCISMRLIRYYRQGLLRRKKVGHCYKYKLSIKGEERLYYLWNKFNLLSAPPGWELMGRIGEIQYQLARARGKLAIQMLENSLTKRIEQTKRLIF